jgi:UPF0176 protein
MNIVHIAGYKFINLSDLDALRCSFLEHSAALRGTILLSKEGININVSGERKAIDAFLEILHSHAAFKDMTFRETFTQVPPYQRFKVKIKKEIISFRQKGVHPEKQRAPHISPEELKRWLDEKRDFTLLDTRNDYEVAYGTFSNATIMNLADFSEFPAASKNLNPKKTVVMFCTGGIRCEKAGLHLLNEGFQEVYQLDGGILKYFQDVGDAHFEGQCFVFDERIALNAKLEGL